MRARQDLRTVRLLRSYRSNNAGEVCGFPATEAASLVGSGVAVWHGDAPLQPSATGGDALGGSGDDTQGGGDGDGGDDSAPLQPSATGRTIRHAGRGMYHVIGADGKQITESAIPRVDAEALAAQG